MQKFYGPKTQPLIEFPPSVLPPLSGLLLRNLILYEAKLIQHAKKNYKIK
jgi:hypothetical protein